MIIWTLSSVIWVPKSQVLFRVYIGDILSSYIRIPFFNNQDSMEFHDDFFLGSKVFSGWTFPENCPTTIAKIAALFKTAGGVFACEAWIKEITTMKNVAENRVIESPSMQICSDFEGLPSIMHCLEWKNYWPPQKGRLFDEVDESKLNGKTVRRSFHGSISLQRQK